MKTAIYNCLWRPFKRGIGNVRICGFLAALALGFTGPHLSAAPTVTTLSEIPYFSYPAYYGYGDGPVQWSQFHTPCGLALDSTGNILLIADRDNNAIRYVDLSDNMVWTFDIEETNRLNKPIAVAVDSAYNVYVLNRGNGNNGSLVRFDSFGENATNLVVGLTNAAGMAMDRAGNIYLTVRSNTLLKITPAGVKTTVTTNFPANTSLQGIVVKRNGLIAACDSGRHGIYLIDPDTGVVTTNAGFRGAGDFATNAFYQMSSSTAKFNQPMGVAEAGDGTLIVTDYGNHRVKVVLNNGVVTNLYGVNSNFWYGPLDPANNVFPGWWDGVTTNRDMVGTVEARLPVGVVFAPDGTIYTSEIYYHVIRKVTGAGLPLPPPPPPPVPAPEIGWVSFPYPTFLSFLNTGTSFVFNNDVIIAIRGAPGSQVFYTSGPTPTVGSIPNPSRTNGSTPPYYADNLPESSVTDLGAARYPDMTIKAIGTKNDGSPDSPIVEARFQFVTATPTIVGNNAAQFYVSNITVGAEMWYTWDGSDPVRNGSNSFGPVFSGAQISATTNLTSGTLTFKIRAYRDNYQPSGIAQQTFSATNYSANKISFGLADREPRSSFLARPGQFFYAPVTLSVLPGTVIYSLQFNVTVTNGPTTPNPIVNGAGINFFSMLMSRVPPDEGQYYPPASGQWYLTIPTFTWDDLSGSFINTLFVNTNNNLLGVGWLYRTGFKYKYLPFVDFDTTAQDLIKYSIAHDTLFEKENGVVVAGAYSFRVPPNAGIGDQYFIQLGSPSATSDGVGAPGANVLIEPPRSRQAVTVTNTFYLVGDAAPFRWFNAGDFGEGILDNADVMQVFQSAVLGVNMPPTSPPCDLYLAMDSSGRLGVWDDANQYYTDPGVNMSPFEQQAMFDGNDQTINTNAFGDGVLDIADVYVTFRRSLDPSLVWFIREWRNGQFVAKPTPNLAYNSNNPAGSLPKSSQGSIPKSAGQTTYQLSSVLFGAGDATASAGQTIQIPITARVLGEYPLRVLGLNITVQPLDGSPAIAQQVVFTPSPALGNPTITVSKHAGNFSAAWLNSGITGVTGTATLGMLTVKIPAGAPANAAYAVYFEHASASPNGIASFPKRTQTGLVTLSDRSASSWGDGIPDSWRLRYFGSLNNILSAATADADGDGMTNLEEYRAGTDPNDASSHFKLKGSKGSATADMVVRWPSAAGKSYVVEIAPTLYGPSWTPVSTNIGTGFELQYRDTGAGSGPRFYRVRLLP